MKTFRLLLVGFLFTTWIAWPIQAGLAQDSVPISDEGCGYFAFWKAQV